MLSPPSITDIAILFPSIIGEQELDELKDEWRAYRRSEPLPIGEMTIPGYWHNLGMTKNSMQQVRFKLLSKLFIHLTILPPLPSSQWFSTYGAPKPSPSGFRTDFVSSNKIYGGTNHHSAFKTQSTTMKKGRLTK